MKLLPMTRKSLLMDPLSTTLNWISVQPFNKSLQFPTDIYSIFVCFIGWGLLYMGLSLFVFPPIGHLIVPLKDAEKERLKLSTAIWKLSNFGILAMFGTYIAYQEPWIFSPKEYFVGWPNHEMSNLIKTYYQMEFASYAFALMLMPFEPKQTVTDYAALLIHHTATLFLIWTSYIYSFHRIGFVIAFLHDLSDPFMEAAKITLYSGRPKAADALFGLFAIVFITTRNIIYPFYVIRSYPLYGKNADGTMVPSNDWFWPFMISLCTLAALHAYWSSLILKMAYKGVVNKGVSDDIRNVEDE